MLWVALWAVLLVLAVVVLVVLVRRVVRAGTAVVVELGQAGERLTAISEQVQQLGAPTTEPAPPAVFSDVAELRREHDRRRRASRRRWRR